MFSRALTYRYTKGYSQSAAELKSRLNKADAVLIGAGAGLSTAAGYTYSGERFERYFKDFSDRYGFTDMYSGGFYPYKTLEEFWAFWSRNIEANRYTDTGSTVYKELLEIVRNKEYFVLTTNVDHCFQKAGFDKKRLFYTQGDYGLFQCSKACHNKTYDNEAVVREMVARQTDMKIPSELIPKCPVCGAPMTTNLRVDETFVQDEGWYRACSSYEDFIRRYEDGNILLLELGVGMNTPVIIKYPFWKMTGQNRSAVYACLNYGEAFCPDTIKRQSICIDGDIADVLRELKNG